MALVKITQSIIPAGNKSRLPLKKKEIRWVVIHETGNKAKGAGAKNHAAFLQNVAKANNQYYSWHYTVDDKEIYQHMPDDEVAFHAGDGTSQEGGNYMGIGIEICVNPESNFAVAVENAASLSADLLDKYNLPLSAVKQHHDFSSYGKNCPETIRNTGRWPAFLESVKKHMQTADSGKESVVPVKPVAIGEIAVNSVVTIDTGAVYGGLSSTRGKPVPTLRCETAQYIVSKIQTNAGVKEALLSGLNSWVAVSSLNLVSAAPITPAAPKAPVNPYARGSKIKLTNAMLFGSSTTTTFRKISGAYYIYDGIEINGRYRITNSPARVGALPLANNVTGFVGKADIK